MISHSVFGKFYIFSDPPSPRKVNISTFCSPYWLCTFDNSKIWASIGICYLIPCLLNCFMIGQTRIYGVWPLVPEGVWCLVTPAKSLVLLPTAHLCVAASTLLLQIVAWMSAMHEWESSHDGRRPPNLGRSCLFFHTNGSSLSWLMWVCGWSYMWVISVIVYARKCSFVLISLTIEGFPPNMSARQFLNDVASSDAFESSSL